VVPKVVNIFVPVPAHFSHGQAYANLIVNSGNQNNNE
jgi:hypothetical protein